MSKLFQIIDSAPGNKVVYDIWQLLFPDISDSTKENVLLLIAQQYFEDHTYALNSWMISIQEVFNQCTWQIYKHRKYI